MPWPMASCSRMPEAPAASTTGISPAGGWTASNRIIVFATASFDELIEASRRVVAEVGARGAIR